MRDIMFNKNNNQQPYPYQYDNQVQRLYYEIQEDKRKIKELTKRIRRLEEFLNIRFDDEEFN